MTEEQLKNLAIIKRQMADEDTDICEKVNGYCQGVPCRECPFFTVIC